MLKSLQSKKENKVRAMKAEFVSDDNGAINDETEQYGTDDDGDDDSLAAMASDEDKDYSEFVDACGRSLCNEAARERNKASTPPNNWATTAPKIVTPPGKQNGGDGNGGIGGKIPEQNQFLYGPEGLMFNMNEPWERSLQRQIQSGIKDQHILFNDKHNNRTLLLGHTESRDFAMEVSRDDVSLGTSGSSTVPHRMQVIHRSFLNNYMMQQQQQHRQQQQERQQQQQQHSNYRYDMPPLDHQYYDEEFAGLPKKKDVGCPIGDVVKGCRSHDESTVSYLTNQFGPYEEIRDELQYTYSNHTSGATHFAEARNDYSKSTNQLGAIGRNKERAINMSNNPYSSVVMASSLQKGHNIPNDSNNYYAKFLEMEHQSLHDESNSATNHTVNSMHTINGVYNNLMAPDPACFCMGYNMLDYLLPPGVGSPDGVTHRNSRQRYRGGNGGAGVSLPRLPRVDENSSKSGNNRSVINLAHPGDAMHYLRNNNNNNGPEPKHLNVKNGGQNKKTPFIPCNENYCGIDV